MLDSGLKYYEKILGCCRDKGAWMTSCDDMWEWWSGKSEGAQLPGSGRR
jgi:hypothetical protein